MIVTKKALPRRTFLRGMGATLALPLLDAMVPSMTALARTPASPVRLRRLGFVFMPMGCDITRWTPPGEDSLDELSPSLSSLAPVKEHVTGNVHASDLQHRGFAGPRRLDQIEEDDPATVRKGQDEVGAFDLNLGIGWIEVDDESLTRLGGDFHRLARRRPVDRNAARNPLADRGLGPLGPGDHPPSPGGYRGVKRPIGDRTGRPSMIHRIARAIVGYDLFSTVLTPQVHPFGRHGCRAC